MDSPPLIRCRPYYTSHKSKGRSEIPGTPRTTLKGNLLLHPDVGHIFRKRIFLCFAERPCGLEVIVVDEGVDRVMHVAVIGSLEVRDADEVKRDHLGIRGVRAIHG